VQIGRAAALGGRLGGAVQPLFRPGNACGGIPLNFNRDITADGGLVVDGWMRFPEGMTFRRLFRSPGECRGMRFDPDALINA
jgi:hypothetical protein